LDLRLLTLPVAATVAAISAAALGVSLTARPRVSRLLIPLSGGFLVLVAVFGLIPEIVEDLGWARVLPLVALGTGLLFALDRAAFPVCPSCDHHAEKDAEKGLAGPLMAATALHAFVDGWGLVAVQVHARGHGALAGGAIAAAILLHKIPEGLALGSMSGVLMGGQGTALGWCAAVEFSTLAGAAIGLWLTPAEWVGYPLAIAAGTFLFLGIQALRTGLFLHSREIRPT
jgi:zinc and cadmium transporter